MKKFFKKIGKGLKKLGKGIMKIMNSKIGRIIGMVSLAFGVGAVFKAMYQGLTQGTAQAAASAAQSSSAVVVEEGVSTAQQRAAKEAAKAATEKATEEAVKRTAEASADLGAKVSQDLGRELTTNGNIAINSAAEAATKIGTLADNASVTGAGNISSAVDSGLKSSLNNTAKFAGDSDVVRRYTPQEVLTQTPAPVETVVKTPPVEGTSLLSPEEIARQGTTGTTLKSAYAPYEPSLLSPGQLDLSQAGTAVEVGLTGPLPEGASTYNPNADLLTAAEKAEITDFSKLSPKKLADALKNPEVRTRYDQLTPFSEGLKTEAGTSLQLTPSSQLPGVQEFTSFKEAFQAGDNLLSGAGNVAERFMTYDLGELTKGKLTGFIGSRGAYNTATVAARTFAGPEEISAPAGRNPYSAAISAGLAEQGATTAYQPQTVAMDFSNQMATGNVTNPFTTLNNIRQKAGFGNIYGSLNSVAGIVS